MKLSSLHERVSLNIGCGRALLPGWVNIDLYPSAPEVVQGDVCKGLDFPSGSVHEIVLNNVIEHVENIPAAIDELSRLLVPNGRAWLITPHFTSADSWRDPTHRWHLSCESLNYLAASKHSHLTSPSLVVERVNLSFPGGLGLISRTLYKISHSYWEKHLCFIFRAQTIVFIVRKVHEK